VLSKSIATRLEPSKIDTTEISTAQRDKLFDAGSFEGLDQYISKLLNWTIDPFLKEKFNLFLKHRKEKGDHSSGHALDNWLSVV
jgi:hypothetical protein